ncbi:hypothetical protein DN412_11625, partial [Cupriavidus lacunae]
RENSRVNASLAKLTTPYLEISQPQATCSAAEAVLLLYKGMPSSGLAQSEVSMALLPIVRREQ